MCDGITGDSVEMIPTKRCDRCDQLYPEVESACTICKDISPGVELVLFKLKKEYEFQSRSKLGFIFFYISVIIGVILLVYL